MVGGELFGRVRERSRVQAHHFGRRPGTRLALALLSLIGACTEPVARTPVKASIDADSVVRLATVRIDVVVEGQLGGMSAAWEMLASPAFKPSPQRPDEWPFEFTIESDKTNFDRFSMTATARDKQGSVVARAQTLRDRSQARRSGLHVHFDTACFRRTELCDEEQTCVGGVCVDAASNEVQPPVEGGQSTVTTMSPVTGSPEAPEGVAAAGTTCSDGERACVEHGSRVPLRCEGGRWVEQTQCGDKERCDTSDGPDRGACKSIAEECRNRQANVPYCDGDAMRVCEDLVRSKARLCSDHEAARRCSRPYRRAAA